MENSIGVIQYGLGPTTCEENIRLLFEGGVHGDIATTAIVVNSIPRLLKLPPGLRTMLDMPPPHLMTK